MTDGQRSAVEQLREIETASVGVLEILGITEPSEGQSYAFADLSVYCGDMPRVPEGLPLRKRERLRVLIPADFPFEHPSIITLHKRWAGFSHVQWKWVLCLYQSSSTEWIPGDGMFGFIQRLDTWIRRGALNELDPTGAPLHPPVAYVPSGPARSVIPRVDTPEVSERPWFGFAHLRTVSEQRVDICGWSAIGSENTPSGVAAAILLPEPLPFEFPAKVKDLMEELTARGVPQELLLAVLGLSVLRNEEQSPLYVIVGTPMRGIRGGKLRQHLSAWYLDPGIALGLRLALEKYETHERLREIGEECERIVLDWAREAKVSWCRVREDRPEVTIRRDSGSPMTWFVGRTISLWGCGALGSYLGDCLTRAGVRKLILRDAGIVTPGVLARQLFDDADIGRPKVEALGDRLQRIRPDLEIERHYEDLLEGPLARDDWSDGADLVIDATAATAVLAKLEYRRWISPADPVPVVSMAIGHRAEEGLVLVAGAGHSGGPADVSRRTKVATGETPDCRAFLGEFWPVLPRTDVFQPEPGCSENTFVGSAADVAVLAGMMLNYAALELAEPGGVTAGSRLVRQPHTVASDGPIQAGFHWGPDLICHDPHTGYEVRIAPTAWQA
ncbi:MAG TPA: ThiF family adenylyltransferase, partial [Armatimonadota bacterium]|nr:ThiF family adenylyltransferase [Armatimonadota bacterium]